MRHNQNEQDKNHTMLFDEIIATIPDLSTQERTRLIRLLADSLLDEETPQKEKTYSILEFEGVGYHLWDGIDAQEYLNQIRNKWNISS